MENMKLLVIGNLETVTMFQLLGAEGIVVTDAEQLKDVHLDLEARKPTLGSILIGGELYDEDSRYLSRIRSMGVPTIFLPSGQTGADAGQLALEELTERAMGMKLSL